MNDDAGTPEASGGWRIAVIGAGSWGTALALHAASSGHDVRLWVRRPALAERFSAARENDEYLSGFMFPESLSVVSDPAAAMSGSGESAARGGPAARGLDGHERS